MHAALPSELVWSGWCWKIVSRSTEAGSRSWACLRRLQPPLPLTPLHGPFSADFRWVTLPEIQPTPIQLTKGQAKVFESLWSFKGEDTTAERIMQRAGLSSDKPSDLFKIKPKDRGKPGPAAQHAAYRALVQAQQRAGLYAMPCAAEKGGR